METINVGPIDRAVNPAVPDTLTAAIAQQRARVLALEAAVSDARDERTRADAELDAAIRARDRAVWKFAQLGALMGEASDQ